LAQQAARGQELPLELLLFGVQSPINIGMSLRVAETYGFGVTIFDRHGVLDDPEKLKTIEDFSCGSLSRRGVAHLSKEAELSRHCAGRRIIVTSILPGACALPGLRFQPRDIIVLGNEYDGIPGSFLATADLQLHIPMPHIWTPKPTSWYPIDPTRTAPVSH